MVKRHPHLRDVVRLPFLKRITSPHARRHLLAWALGILLMLLGSALASIASYQSVAHPVVVDTAGYFLHGVGAIPILRHLEPVWLVLVGE